MIQWGSNGAPMGLQWEEISKNNLGDLLFCSYMRIVFVGFYGVLIIPKWLIRSPDILQYFLDDFWNFQNLDFVWTRSGPLHFLFITKTPQKMKKLMESSLKNIIRSYLNFLELQKNS